MTGLQASACGHLSNCCDLCCPQEHMPASWRTVQINASSRGARIILDMLSSTELRLVLHTGDSPVKKGSEDTTQLAGLRAVHIEHANPHLERALRLQLVREGDELQMNSLIGYLNQIRAKLSKQSHKEAQ